MLPSQGWAYCASEVLDIGRPQVVALLQDAGAAAVSVHGRSMEQRYSKAADWGLIGEVVAGHDIPVIGNGDILTHYDARRHFESSGCLAVRRQPPAFPAVRGIPYESVCITGVAFRGRGCG
jgi:Dihydrouridine synthase (Dus)